MYLKKLEIHGFKSFAEKTRCNFSNGITVIVGPNGSGKSNIADALRWVLGEQSIKTLRGGKAEDIIFAGAKNRKPLGMAEVSMVLNNETGLFPIAFSEVKVTRRVYRSGESEYLINDAPCRLKDIYDLFADSGLGKDALAIVGQGKIDEILSVRAEDRRGLIEEAAGITRYRTRKKEAERKLYNTERDLERITDILFTLEERVDPLSQQKQKAEEYFEYKAELHELELQMLAQQLTSADSKKQELVTKINQHKDDFFVKQADIRSLEAELEDKKLKLLKEEENISGLQQELFDISTKWEKFSSDLKLTEEKRTFINEKIQTNQNQIKALTETLKKLNNNQETKSAEINEKTAVKQNICLRLATIENDKAQKLATVNSYEERLDNLKNAAFEKAQELADAKNSMSNLIKNKEKNIQAAEMIQQKISQLEQQLHTLKQHFSEQQKGHDELKDELHAINEKEAMLQGSFQNLQQKQAQLSSEVMEKSSNAESIRKQHAFYVDMESKHEGYGHAVKTLLEAKNTGDARFKNLHGTVADVITVESKFETAIETALGGAIQNIITDTEETASFAIEFLKKKHAGRATFLPLNVVKGERVTNSRYKIASELVTTDKAYLALIEYLLGRTLVTENMQEAIHAARETKHRYKIVTLEGDVIFPGGSMSGGSNPKKQASLLARKRLIEDLGKKAQDLLKETVDLRKKAEDNLMLLKENEKQLAVLGLNKSALLDKVSVSDKEIALNTQRLNALQHEIAEKNTEGEYLKKEENIILTEISSAQKYVEVKEEEYQNISQETQHFTEALRLVRKENDTDNTVLLDLKTELARLEEEIKSRRYELEGLTREIAEKVLLRDGLDEENLKLEADLQEKTVQINDLLEKLDTTSKQRVELENILQNAKERKQQQYMDSFEDEQKLKLLQKQFSALSEEIHAQEVKLAKVEAETEGLNEKLVSEFEKTLEEAYQELKQDFNKRFAQERIKILHKQINSLGTVNLNAIEEHKEVTEKLTFLSEQKTDLASAKDSLFKVIAEIEKEMCLKFMETFEAVNSEFQNIFKTIFNGGTAKLTLSDETKPLESGIEIIVQPPGKKLQHLMLLSGGEKALTAIALLFAVFRIKPAPFCVLDEIEAALDEANVERFAAFLKDYAAKTQFIIISHRQGTMEVADTLYGTTMEESGVTKLISVKFDDRKVG